MASRPSSVTCSAVTESAETASAVRYLADSGCDVVVLPELWVCGYDLRTLSGRVHGGGPVALRPGPGQAAGRRLRPRAWGRGRAERGTLVFETGAGTTLEVHVPLQEARESAVGRLGYTKRDEATS